MRFLIDRDAMAEAVAWTVRALPARPAMPVLAGMLIDVGERLELSCFDYEVSAKAAAEVTVLEPGRVLVPGRLLADIVRSLPAGRIEIATVGSETILTCGGSEFGLVTMPVEDYPTLPEMPPTVGTVSGETLATAVSQVAVASSKDDTLPMLTAVRMDVADELVSLACTDRFRIAGRDLVWTPARPELTAEVMIPAKVLVDATKSLRTGEVSVGLSETLIGFSADGRSMTTRLMDEQFIEYRSRLVVKWNSRAEIEVAPLIDAVKRIAIVAERNSPITLSFTGGEVVVRGGSADASRGVEVLKCGLEGDDITLAFQPQWFLDGLAGVQSELVRLECTTPTRPVLITGETLDYRYLVMPLRQG
ncbi:DNA polymerase III subunit beta [Rhizohabitans arisaemae]|uniref:DNA polymerase III subunit beta n=1 Tax=Rhizohabitans arisaemae TaxID=2720610 RepID=UPI0024B27797|nr:DNA polymerase III subunit beta [Rhizohabitans arisaemae]